MNDLVSMNKHSPPSMSARQLMTEQACTSMTAQAYTSMTDLSGIDKVIFVGRSAQVCVALT